MSHLLNAPFARLLTACSITKFQLLIYSQGGDADYCTWALKLKQLDSKVGLLKEISSIIDRGINEDGFLVQEVRLNALSSCVLNYTAAIEFFLSDLIILKLRDKRLFKRALNLSEMVVNKFDIVEYSTIEALQSKYVDQLSGEFASGNLWTKKLGNSCRLFDVLFDKNLVVVKSVDSIFEQRNRIAHLNRLHHLPFQILRLDGRSFEISDLRDDDAFLNFSLELLNIMDTNVKLLDDLQHQIQTKWEIET